MHSKETMSILSLKYELNQIKNRKMLKFRQLTPQGIYPLDPHFTP